MNTLVLYDDEAARGFEPFALTRPVSELRAGTEIVRRRWETALGAEATAFVGAAHLADVAGQATGAGQRLPEQELDLGVDTAQIVGGPPRQRVVHRGVEPQQDLLPRPTHSAIILISHLGRQRTAGS